MCRPSGEKKAIIAPRKDALKIGGRKGNNTLSKKNALLIGGFSSRSKGRVERCFQKRKER